jgi:molybdopterin-guanine dinucleotide biosynthesis protein A
MATRFPDLTVAILAGGKSSRMGMDKAFARLRGRPLIEDVLAKTADLGVETVIITNQPDGYRYLDVPLFDDVLPEKGALGGLYSALYYSSRPRTLCLACDMPFVVRPLLEHLIALSAAAEAVVPRLPAGPEGKLEAEPFRAVYARDACLGPIRAALDAGRLRVISFFPEVRLRFVDQAEIEQFDPEHLSFFNVNTPEDLEAARQLAVRRTT